MDGFSRIRETLLEASGRLIKAVRRGFGNEQTLDFASAMANDWITLVEGAGSGAS
jgi:hypothetical protein